MKIIKLLSILSVLITIAAISFSLINQYKSQKDIASPYPATIMDSLNSQLNAMKEHSLQSAGDTISKKELNFKLNELQTTMYMAKAEKNSAKVENGFSKETFWIKVVFSGIFCLAVLFVILSQKYDSETKKWAFSVMTLIAGVWIGTIS